MINFYNLAKSVILCLLLFLGVQTTTMAQVQSDGPGVTDDLGGGNGPTATSFTLPAGNDRLIVVCVQGISQTSVTFNGGANFIPGPTAEEGLSNVDAALFYQVQGSSVSPTTGNIAVTGNTLLGVVIASFNNVDQASPIGNVNNTTQNGTAATSSSLPVTSSAVGNMICDCLGGYETVGVAPTFTVNGSQTQIGNVAGTFQSRTAMSIESGTGAISMDWTISGFTNSSYGLGHSGMEIKSAGVLPVELIHFDARPKNNSIVLNWATASELNNRGFEVQRALGNQEYETLGFIQGKGTTFDAQEYQYIDKKVKPNQLYYYRLKQIDFDGASAFSDYATAQIDASLVGLQEFYPNPTKTGFTNIDYPVAANGNLTITVYDIAGRVLHNESRQVGEGLNSLQFDFTNIGNGSFFVKLEQDGEAVYKKLSIVKQ